MADDALKSYPSLDPKWFEPRDRARRAFFQSLTLELRSAMNDAEWEIFLWEAGFNRGLDVAVKAVRAEIEAIRKGS